MTRHRESVYEVGRFFIIMYATMHAGITFVGNVGSYCTSCCPSFFNRASSLHNKNRIQKLKECIDLMASQREDIEVIRKALETSQMDERAFYQSSMLQQSKYIVRQSGGRYINNIHQRSDMLHYLYELLMTYPEFEAEDHVSSHDLDVFFNERNKHHQNIMMLVEMYLPETYAVLHDASFVLKT